MAKNNQAEIEILIKDQVTKALERIDKRLVTIEKTARSATKKTESQFSKLGTTAQTALGFTAANAISTVVGEAKRLAVEGVQSAIAFETQLKSLELQTGRTADALLNDLTVATKGLVSQLDLAYAANRALALGLQRDDLPGLFEVAAARARILGVSVTQATNDIVTGIGRSSPLILDNLGITLRLSDAYAEYASQLGISTSELTKQQQTAALTNAVIQRSENIVRAQAIATETATDRLERFTAQLKDALRYFAEAQLYTLEKIFEDSATAFANSAVEVRYLTDGMEMLVDQISSLESESSLALDTINNLKDALSGVADQQTEAEYAAQQQINEALRDRLLIEREINQLGGTERLTNLQNELAEAERLAKENQQASGATQISAVERENIARIKAELDTEELKKIDQLKAKLDEISQIEDQARINLQIEQAERQVALDQAIDQARERNLLELDLAENINQITENLQKEIENAQTAVDRREEIKTSLEESNRLLGSFLDKQEEVVEQLKEEYFWRQRIRAQFGTLPT